MQKETSRSKFGWIIGGGVLVVIIGLLVAANTGPGKLDGFAQCLKKKGVTFYGAFWCPHCQNQKTLFGKSQKYLPYVECSTPDAKDQLPICKQKKVDGYPTWEFPDGSRESGEVALQTLADKSGCALPQ